MNKPKCYRCGAERDMLTSIKNDPSDPKYVAGCGVAVCEKCLEKARGGK